MTLGTVQLITLGTVQRILLLSELVSSTANIATKRIGECN
jgi:hypothetical protein